MESASETSDTDVSSDEEIFVDRDQFRKRPNTPMSPEIVTREIVKDPEWKPLIMPDKTNILNYVKERSDMLESDVIKSAIGMINLLESNVVDSASKEQFAQYAFCYIAWLLANGKFATDKPSFYLLVKALFHRYIVVHGYHSLTAIYNTVFNDGQYDNIKDTAVFYPCLTDEWQTERIREYQESQLQIEYRRRAKRSQPKYTAGEIIGAKDKEGRWWLSKVLAVYTHQEHAVYYVAFEGWGDQFNEFIVDGFRMEKYNPKKHKYFRPAWRKE